jgi:uncharacterized protein YbaP (TraB family)
VVVALACACKDAHDSHDISSVGSAAPRGSGSAGSAAVPTGSDPWAAPIRDDGLPSLSERVARANKLCPAVTGPYFFEVSKDGKVSHILGTRHVSVSLAKFPEVVRSNIRSAKLAVFEVAPDDTSGTRAKDEPLRDELGSADWNHLRELVGDDTAQELVKAAPDTAAITMLVLYEDITNMLDKQIEDMVAAAKIPAIGLETAAFQDDVLAKLLDFRMLRATVENTKDRAEIQQESADDLTQYCAGTDDTPGMDDKEKAKMRKAGYTDAELAAMDETLVFARNNSWIPKFEELFKQGDVFVAVGADHLIGKRGVVSLLRARGFTVTRITR